MALLEIKNLTVEFKTGSGFFRAVDGVSLTVDKGEVLAIVGESGSGKSVSMLAVMGLLPWTANVTADRMTFEGNDLLGMTRQGAPHDHRQGHRHDLPGADVEPQPLLHGRLPDHGGAEDPSRPRQAGAPQARRRTAGPCRHSVAETAALLLPAPAFRRHEPARDDRHGDRLQSEAPDRRRTDDRARCDHPGADPRPAGEAAEGDRHGPRAHHAFDGRGGRNRRARERAICRAEGGGAEGRRPFPRSAPSLYGSTSLGPAGARHRPPPALHPGRRARPVRPAHGLPVLAALLARHRSLPHGQFRCG